MSNKIFSTSCIGNPFKFLYLGNTSNFFATREWNNITLKRIKVETWKIKFCLSYTYDNDTNPKSKAIRHVIWISKPKNPEISLGGSHNFSSKTN